MQLKTLTAAILIASSATLITACGGGSSSTSTEQGFNLENAQKVLVTNADIALASYNDSVITAKALQTVLSSFKANPTDANFTAAKTAWLVSREPYGQTEVYRFRNSPIDSTDYSSEDGPEGDINAWPLGEALIDYVTTGTDFGDDQVGVTAHETGVADPIPTNNIINSTSIVINETLISNTATADDEHDVIAGYHAIEFLLWGQDLNNDGSADTLTTRDATAGNRPLSDFTSAANADRRHTYLEVAAAKLVSDLESVRDGWAQGASYRTAFTTVTNEAEAKEKLTEILTGMGTLSEGELAGERMQIAYSSNSQEDEHSCFSDNTHRDIWLNAEGIANSYYGDYAGYSSDLSTSDNEVSNAVNGYGLDDYLTDAGLTEIKAEVEALLTDTQTNYTEIDDLARNGNMPVDVQIQPANRSNDMPMAKTIISLNKQSTAIQKIATELGLGDVVDDDGSACDTTTPGNTCGE
ncbi:MAG: putative iron-regulated protein [Cocleimonas sp.]|jgi:putative iron-regulated protein